MKSVFKLKNIIIAVLFFTATHFAKAQNDTIWYDQNWLTVTKKINAHYFRPSPKPEGKGFKITDHYISGAKQMEGISLSETSQKWVGKVYWYYPNGAISSIRFFSESHKMMKEESYYQNNQLKYSIAYINNEEDGNFVSYHPNGTIAEKGHYKKGAKSGNWEFYNTNGALIETVTF